VYRVIPDERPLIEQTLKDLCDKEGCSLVVTTGGTGPAPRDVTPEATEAVSERRSQPARQCSAATPKCIHACGSSTWRPESLCMLVCRCVSA
jgi:molybdopterin-biosynthesis enzyme MoeA-like protein